MGYKITNPVTGDVVKTSWGKRAWDAEMAFQTDAVNYKMFQEQNDFNLNMYERQRQDAQSDWNRDTQYNEQIYWEHLNDERAYNDPSAERQRLVNAGYNPLLLGSNGSSSGGSSVSTSFAPTENTPDAPMSANWEGAARVGDNAPSALDIINSVVGSVSSLVGAFKQGVEAYELPQYVFNDTERAASENALRNMYLRKMFIEEPNWVNEQMANINYKKASAAAQTQVAETQKATEAFIKEQTAWLPDISRAQIDESVSRYLSNYKNIELMSSYINVNDETIRSIAQQILESRSREAVNWNTSKSLELENNLVELYGEDNYKAGLQASEDAHNEYLVNLLYQSLSIKKEDRGLWLEALHDAHIYTDDDLKDFLFTIRQIKSGAVLSPRQQQRWYEPISALLPSLVAAGYLGVKAAGSFMSRGVAPVALPSTNIYGQPVNTRSWKSPYVPNLQ